MTLGQKIREARIQMGLTQKQLVGDQITRNMLSKIENDSATPSVRTLEYLAKKLALPAGYFIEDSIYSSSASPDGLDPMREAYRDGRYLDCIGLLEEDKTAGTTDEGYLLHARSALAAAHESILAGDFASAKEFADSADYYNKEGIYYSAEIDAEMSLILAECALVLDISEFEDNAREFERAIRTISFSARYGLARAEFLLKTGETELASRILDRLSEVTGRLKTKRLYLKGLLLMAQSRFADAADMLTGAEAGLDSDPTLAPGIYSALETCYREQEDFKMAYHYASKQLR
jgi:transcriptional regulator with XRE-family HTH domain